MKTKRQVWEEIYNSIKLEQYVKFTVDAKTGQNDLKYDSYFNRVLKYSKSKKLTALARQGLTVPHTLTNDCSCHDCVQFGLTRHPTDIVQ